MIMEDSSAELLLRALIDVTATLQTPIVPTLAAAGAVETFALVLVLTILPSALMKALHGLALALFVWILDAALANHAHAPSKSAINAAKVTSAKRVTSAKSAKTAKSAPSLVMPVPAPVAAKNSSSSRPP
jgi:hypothetical protein